MRRIFYILILVFLLCSCGSVKPVYTADTVYVNKTEYVDKIKYDSVYLDRYHYIYQQGDTIYKVDSIYDYRYILKEDTIIRTDTIYKAQEKVVETNKLKKWQSWSIIGFYALISIILVYVAMRIYKHK